MARLLRIGVIGYGNRVSGMARQMNRLDPGFRIAAIADPRQAEIARRGDPLLANAAFHRNADALLSSGRFDGIMVGTRCSLHTPLALKVARHKTPLFLEKPVATSFPQVKALAGALRRFAAPVVVSFPLRVSPIVARVKAILDGGELGPVAHVVAFNDVPYGDVYFGGWYRDDAETGGLFLQKATHDFDYLMHLVGSPVRRVAAMTSQRVWGGRRSKPFELFCKHCGIRRTCPESPFSGSRSMLDSRGRKAWGPWRKCLYSAAIRNEDSGNALLEFANGVQASYTQNFFARYKTARRGARLYAYRGTVEFDWYTNKVLVFRHDRPAVKVIDMAGGEAHFGGDHELCRDFLAAVRRRKEGRTPLQTGVQSALTCLWARKSAATGRFCEVRMPR